MPTQTPAHEIPHPFIPGQMIRPSAMDPGQHGYSMAPVPQTCVTIASVVPWRLQSEKFFQLRGMPVFEIPAAKKGSYELLRLYDSSSVLFDPSSGSLTDAPGYKEVRRPAVDFQNPRNGYAENLIEYWAGGRPGGEAGRLGVAIVIGTKPWQADNQPTRDELNALNLMQRKWFEYLINKADVAFVSQDPRVKNRVAWQECIRALTYANAYYDVPITDINGRNIHGWYTTSGTTGVDSAMSRCPACQEPINSQAFICRSCSTNLADFFHERKIKVDGKMFPGVVNELEWRAANKGTLPRA